MLISHTSKVMLKILQARFQQYANCELPNVQAGFRKARGARDQIINICWTIKKAREFQKSIYLFFIDYTKAFDCVEITTNCGKFLKRQELPYHLTCLLQNLYAGQGATVRYGHGITKHGTMDWFEFGKGVHQYTSIYISCILFLLI